MSFQLTDLKKYFFTFLAYIAKVLDFFATLFQRFYDCSAVGEFVDKWEDIFAAVIYRRSRWIGFIPLIIGMIIVFAVMGNGFFNWLVLAAFLLIIGIIMMGHAEEVRN